MKSTSSPPADDSLSWSIPVMRAGYSGRALIYLIVAGLSLWGIWQGVGATGTSDALARLERSTGGMILLVLITLGMICYGVWRLIDAAFDLEAYGTDGKGIVARLGMVVTALAHFGLAALGVTLLLNIGASGSGGDGSAIAKGARAVMEMPFGRILLGVIGLATVGAGAYYFDKGWDRKYERHLRVNAWTERLSPALRAGVIAQGVIIGAIGALLILAAVRGNPQEAGGMTKVFSWAYTTPFGWVIVAAICVGLLGFALFCAVNALWRVIPRADGPDVSTMAAKAKAKARQAGA